MAPCRKFIQDSRGRGFFFVLFLAVLLAPMGIGSASENPGAGGGMFSTTPDWSDPFLPPRTVPTETTGGRTLDRVMLAQSGGPVSAGEGSGTAPGAIEEAEDVPDPLEPLNRAFFHFNDKLYFYFLKPVAQGYEAVVPEPARVGVRNFFHNLAFPIRFVNCLLQGKVAAAADEFGRFMVNSVFGVAGFLDVVPKDIPRGKEDLGQTLGVYGLGPGFYIVWPFLGPSTLRDSFGMAGDWFLSPVNYAFTELPERVGVRAYDTVNDTSLSIGDYEALKNAALDPYISLRHAYYQNRVSQIKK
jgi:phospholipid-binding lipoprotein MlaA